ncbi:MAG: cytochrome P460 family protein [Pseudomonadales bacterium]
MRRLSLTLVAVVATVCGAKAISDNVSVDYPSDYRTWQHVKSMIIQPGHPLEEPFGGIHHIYANAKAMSGLSNGQYEDGAIFVFDLLAYDDSNKTIVEKNRKRIDLMQYDSEQFSATGGWGFDTFVGDSTTERLVQDVVASCFDCHATAKASNYVFSRYRR